MRLFVLIAILTVLCAGCRVEVYHKKETKPVPAPAPQPPPEAEDNDYNYTSRPVSRPLLRVPGGTVGTGFYWRTDDPRKED